MEKRTRGREEREAMMTRLRGAGLPRTPHAEHRRVPLPRALGTPPPPVGGVRLEPGAEAVYVRVLLSECHIPVREVRHTGPWLVVTIQGKSVPSRPDGPADSESQEWKDNRILGRLTEDLIGRLVPGRSTGDDVAPLTNNFRVFVQDPNHPPDVRAWLQSFAPKPEPRPTPAPPPALPAPSPPARASKPDLSNKEETKLLRGKFREAGLPVVKVGHGRGTAYGWLHVTVVGKRVPRVDGRSDTQSPEWEYNRELERKVTRIIVDNTRRDPSRDDSQTDYFESRFNVTVREPVAHGEGGPSD
jgi:hypothetical protein